MEMSAAGVGSARRSATCGGSALGKGLTGSPGKQCGYIGGHFAGPGLVAAKDPDHWAECGAPGAVRLLRPPAVAGVCNALLFLWTRNSCSSCSQLRRTHRCPVALSPDPRPPTGAPSPLSPAAPVGPCPQALLQLLSLGSTAPMPGTFESPGLSCSVPKGPAASAATWEDATAGPGGCCEPLPSTEGCFLLLLSPPQQEGLRSPAPRAGRAQPLLVLSVCFSPSNESSPTV